MIAIFFQLRRWCRAIAIWLGIITLTGFPILALANAVDGTNKYAWGENIGWLNWGTPEGGVDLNVTAFTGYVWGENVGWISLNCSNTSSCATVDYSVARSVASAGTITISGYAWGENVGWISFNCSNTSTCGTVNYGVTVDQFTGIFSGYAWGENVGWISMNCSNTSSCATVDYKVQVTAPLAPGGQGGGGGGPGGGTPPPPTASPTPIPSGSMTPTPSGTPTPTVTPTETPTPSASGTPPPPTPTATPTASPAPSGPPAPPPSFTPGPGPGGVVGGIVQGVGQFIDNLAQGVFGAVSPPVVSAGAVAAAVAAAVPVAAAVVTVLVNHEVVATGHSLLQIVGIRKKAKVWGVVYDTRTKRPVPFAKLQLLDANGRVLETRYADRDGRYGFLTSAQSMHQQSLALRIVASKENYRFPSTNISLDRDFLVYDKIYHGEQITIKPDTFLHFNIPMDPIKVGARNFGEFGRGLIGAFTERLLNLGFILGCFLVPLNYIRYPTTINLVVGILFFGANLLRTVVLYRPYGVVTDAHTGKPLPFALVTLNDASGTRVDFTVSDEKGRYFLPAERGKDYQLIAYTPANISPQRTHTEHITAHSRTSRRAWVTRNIAL